MMRTPFLATILAATILLGAPALVRAQDDVPAPDPKAEWSKLFADGLDLLRERRIDDSIKAFQACIKLDDKNAVSYYNIACCYAQKKDAPKTVEWLKKSFDKGFLDLAHIGRDSDIDPVRDDDGLKDLLAKTKKKILSSRTEAVRITPSEPRTEKMPLVVYLHAHGAKLDELKERLEPLADMLGATILIPAGRVDAGAASWDTTAETCIVADVEAILQDTTSNVDAKRIVLVGEFDGATLALTLALEHGWKRVVAAAGIYSRPEAEKAKGLRAYLVAPRWSEAALRSANEVRDGLLEAGAQVSVERHDDQGAFHGKGLKAVERGVRWALGEKVALPGAGPPRHF
jgi:predicted esterase